MAKTALTALARLCFVVFAAAVVSATFSAQAQTGGCQLVPDDPNNPTQQIVHCGDGVVARVARDTDYRMITSGDGRPSAEIELDGGALLLEFHPTPARRTFQIRTPHAIAAVRGTRWAVEVEPDKTSTLVLKGVVAVSRSGGGASVLLRSGQGVDVSPGSEPLVVKRWKPARVRALLARFGE